MKIFSGTKLIFPIICLVALVIAAGCAKNPTTTATNQSLQPIDVVSVSGPLQPINPGGPIVEVILKNSGTMAVKSLTGTLELSRAFVFNFEVSAANPLLPGNSTSMRSTLIGAGFSEGIDYNLTIGGTSIDGTTFTYTKKVKIQPPLSSTP
jgi:hypothetical protein